jgi:hypothetical protein
MDRNGKKPKATHNDPPHPERSDTKVHSGDDTSRHGAEARVAAEKAEMEERQVQVNKGKKGPQHL